MYPRMFVSVAVLLALGSTHNGALGDAGQPTELKQSTTPIPGYLMNTKDLIMSQGYVGEDHQMTTEDGYVTTIFRLKNTGKPPVILMHGFCASSDLFVLPESRFAFMLADLGYDIWLGNQRGNRYSRNHIVYSTSDKQYWDYNQHELGAYDMTSIIDYVLNSTGYNQTYVVTHSQGSILFLIAVSSRPEYNNKIKGALLLAPPDVGKHNRKWSFMKKGSLYFLEYLLDLLKQLGANDLYPENNEIQPIMNSMYEEVLRYVFKSILGGRGDPTAEDKYIADIFNAHTSVSIQSAYHMVQMALNGEYAKYDLGYRENVVKYGSVRPPVYDLGKISSKVAFMAGLNDTISTQEGIAELTSKLHNVVSNYVIQEPNYSHLDIVMGNHNGELLKGPLQNLFNQLSKE